MWCGVVWCQDPSQEVSRQQEVPRQAGLVGWYVGYQDPSQGVSRQHGLVCCSAKTPLKRSQDTVGWYSKSLKATWVGIEAPLNRSQGNMD